MTTQKQMRKLLEDEWARADEKILGVLGGSESQGHVGALIGGNFVAPYPAAEDAPVLKAQAALPPLTDVVREGRFHGDEWVHDLAMRALVRASTPDQLAVVCAGHLAAMNGEGWYVSTSGRVAVVAPSSALSSAEPDPDSEAEESPEGGIGRFWGRARSVVSAVSDTITRSGPALTTVWETTADRDAGCLAKRGRSPGGWMVERQVFADGSTVEIRTGLYAA